MKKPVLHTELAYGLAMVGLSLSVALMTRADFGVSMVVAPAYLLYLKLNPVLPFFSLAWRSTPCRRCCSSSPSWR